MFDSQFYLLTYIGMHLRQPCMSTIEIFSQLKGIMTPASEAEQLPSNLKSLFSEFYKMLIYIRMGMQAMKTLQTIRYITVDSMPSNQTCFENFIKEVKVYFMNDKVGDMLEQALSSVAVDSVGRSAIEVLSRCEELCLKFEGDSVDAKVASLIQKVRIYESLITAIQSDKKIGDFTGEEFEAYQYYSSNKEMLRSQKLIMAQKLQKLKIEIDGLQANWPTFTQLGVKFELSNDSIQNRLLKIDEFIKDNLQLCTDISNPSQSQKKNMLIISSLKKQNRSLISKMKDVQYEKLKLRIDLDDMTYRNEVIKNQSFLSSEKQKEEIVTLQYSINYAKKKHEIERLNIKGAVQKLNIKLEAENKKYSKLSVEKERIQNEYQKLKEQKYRVQNELINYFNKKSFEISSIHQSGLKKEKIEACQSRIF